MRAYFLFFIGLLGLGLSACQEDPCADRDCQNGGICIDGRCDCPEGFVGVNCELATDPCLNKNCDPDRSASCQSNANGEARCICEDGFEGELCQAQWTDKYPAQYEVEEICNGKTDLFFSTVDPGPRFKQITLANFHNAQNSTSGARVVANLLQANVFDLYEQFMPFGVVTGAGSYDPDSRELRLNYQIIETDGDTLTCVATYRRQ